MSSRKIESIVSYEKVESIKESIIESKRYKKSKLNYLLIL